MRFDKQRSKQLWVLGLIIASIGINLLGSKLTSLTGITLYLDSVGTVIGSALGGFVPGIIIGFITNLLESISDPAKLYYGVANVLVAVSAGFFVHHGFFKKFYKVIVPILVSGIVIGSLSSVLTWFLYGFATETATSDLASSIYAGTFLSMFGSQICADVLIELIDKAIAFYVAFAVYKLIPVSLKKNVYLTSWRQEPLSERLMEENDKMATKHMSLRAKILVVLIPAMVLIAVASTLISYEIYNENTIDDNTQMATSVANMAASTIDPERVDDYLENGEKASGYQSVKNKLTLLRDSSDQIEYVYVYRILEDGCYVVFDLDTEDTPGSLPGTRIPFDESFDPYIPTLLEGGVIDPIISDDSYGWLLTVYKPIYDSTGKCQCYACVDVSMNRLRETGYRFLAKLFSLFFGLFIVILSIGLWLTKYHIILPINTISNRVSNFAHDTRNDMEENVKEIHELRISTGDEVENLYDAVSKMADDDLKYMLDIQRKNDTIMKMQSGLIMILADIVESRDKCTGDHVRKTARYTKIIMDHMKKLGIHTDMLTDEFVENVYNSAPLHDVGKIHVPDAILNKPGKLTDEEFTIMKNHTSVGAEILDRAIELVPDTGYLREAKNLALYHHEKWNGTGYPMGIAGDDIPLSARIMAVADVFDALVSKRSYKEGMPFEKAMSIIHEGAGSHFDADIVRAFEDATDEVRRVSEMVLG